MIDKLTDLSNWLRTAGFKAEASLTLDTAKATGLSAIASGTIPTLEELKKMFPEEGKSVSPGAIPTLEELKKMFPEAMRNTPSGTIPTLEGLKKMFPEEGKSVSPEEQFGRPEILEDRVLYKQEVLRRGSKDAHAEGLIREIQTLLEKHGYTLEKNGVDGDFGEETEKAILEFQRNNKSKGLRETGEINGATLLALRSPSAIRAAQIGSSSPGTTQEATRGDIPAGIRLPGRTQLADMSPQTKERLYKLTQAEVGSQGARAQQAFMETVANRASIQGKSIDYTVSDHRYYEPINTKGNGSVDNLRPVSSNTQAKYDKILDKVIEGSNITNGATHNASAGVARNWKRKYDGQPGTRRDIGGETFYSKTYEQKKLKKLELSGSPQAVENKSDVPPPRRPSSAGDYILPKVSFVSVPCVSAANLAIKESKEQWNNGNLNESDPKAEPLIQKYFGWTSRNSSRPSNVDRWGTGRRRVGKHKGQKQLNPVKERNQDGVAVDWRHWSAAYVSWIMGQYDGEGARWYVLEGHSGYIRSFKNKRAKVERNPEDHIGKMYYLWFTKEEMDKYGMKPEPGDVVGRNAHCDIYIGGGQMIGGNTCAKNESTRNRKKNCGGTSGPQPLTWKAGAGIIKRVRITGPGSKNMMVA
jgi:hypothetical protein